MILLHLFTFTIIFFNNLVASQIIVPQIIKGIDSSSGVENICVCFPLICNTNKIATDEIVTEENRLRPEETTRFIESSGNSTESDLQSEVSGTTVNKIEVSTESELNNFSTTDFTTFSGATESLFSLDTSSQNTILGESTSILEEIITSGTSTDFESRTNSEVYTDLPVFQAPTQVDISIFNDLTTEYNLETSNKTENVLSKVETNVFTPEFTTSSSKTPYVNGPPVIVCYVVTENPFQKTVSSYYKGSFMNSDGLLGVKPSSSKDDNSRILDLGTSKVVGNKTLLFPSLDVFIKNVGDQSRSLVNDSSINNRLGSTAINPISLDLSNQNHSLNLVDTILLDSSTARSLNSILKDMIELKNVSSLGNMKPRIGNNTSKNNRVVPLKNITQTGKDLSLEFLKFIQNELMNTSATGILGKPTTIRSISSDVLSIIQNNSADLSRNLSRIPTLKPLDLKTFNFVQDTNLTLKNTQGNAMNGSSLANVLNSVKFETSTSKNVRENLFMILQSLGLSNVKQNMNATNRNILGNLSNSTKNKYEISKGFGQNTNSSNLQENSSIGSIIRDVLSIIQDRSVSSFGEPSSPKVFDNLNSTQNTDLVYASHVTDTPMEMTGFSVQKVELDKLKKLRNEIIEKKKTFDGIIELIQELNRTATRRNLGFDEKLLPLRTRNSFHDFESIGG